MARRALLFLLLAASVGWAAKYKFSHLLDPLHKDFPLQPYGWKQWHDLDRATQLKSKGTDPSEWQAPPPANETEEEKKKREEREKKQKEARDKGEFPKDRFPGFQFDKRLRRKALAFDEMIQPASASKLEGLIKRIKKLDKSLARFDRSVQEAQDDYHQIAEQRQKAASVFSENYRKKHGKWPEQVMMSRSLINDYNRKSKTLQRLLAIRQSEEQFHAWLIERLAALLGELGDDERAKPVAALVAGMKDRDWRYRARCAEMLGRLGDPAAVAAFKAAMESENDPLVLADLIRIRVRRGGDGVFDLLAARLDDAEWPVRATVIRELANFRRKETVDLLVARFPKETGRLLDDLGNALKKLTGKNFLPEPDPWRIWWEKNRESWTPPKEVKGEAGDEKKGKGLYFYGIRSSSRRIVFCVDISGSMDFPLDGRDGKKPPRIETAKRELSRALSALDEDARFNLVVYGSSVRTWKKKMQPATLKTKQAARKFVDKLKPAGATNIYDALLQSLELAANRDKKDPEPEADTIYFLTDGNPSHGKIVDPNQILEAITKRNESLGVVIHAVGVSREQNRAFLFNLAKRNGGQFVEHR